MKDAEPIMETQIQIKLFATLSKFRPAASDHYPITPGISIHKLLDELGIPQEKAKLVFIDGVKRDLSSVLQGGERVGIFPPVGGG